MSLEPFENVVAAHGAMVLHVCRAILGPDDADDAWSETFISALRAYPDLPPDSNVAGWLATIAHRRSIDQLRRNRRSPVPVEALADETSDDPRLAPGDDDLLDALDHLTDRQRAAVLYHHVAGLPYLEVGKILGSSEAAARRSAADGIAALRRTYRHSQEGTHR